MNAYAPLDLASVLPGFTDPTTESQTAFRAIMNATAKPGTLAVFDNAFVPPQGINKAAGACLLTLADQDTKLWLDESLQIADLQSWLRFHTGAPLTSSAGESTFALIGDLTNMASLGGFDQGDAKYPDRATTVIVMVTSLTSGPSLTLKGPGIQAEAQIAPEGLNAAFWEERAELVSHFQFGIDLMLCAGNQLISIPRTTRVSF
jgi:alpha-D-ribose 1-methylphosphonate 5-triphosphate synthase subunit PhnH